MQLFVSYARVSRDKVKKAVVDVLTAGGHSVWFDDQVLPGQVWKPTIAEQIARSDGLVYTITKATVSSEWCDWELATAARLDKRILPVLLQRNVSVPASLKRLQHADLSQRNTGREVAKLMRALGEMQKIAPADLPPIPDDPKGSPSRVWQTVKAWEEWAHEMVTADYQAQNESEELVEELPVYLRWATIEWIRGLLFLTNQRVLFEPSHDHRFFLRLYPSIAALVGARDRVAAWLQGTQLSIPLAAIGSVVPSERRFVMPDLITIRCCSGEEYRFGVGPIRKPRQSRLPAPVTPPDPQALARQMVAKIETYRERFQSLS